jgi:hypothetical protein
MSIGDKLFTEFASPKNLKIAFGHIKNEIRRSSLPLDPFWTPGVTAIEVLGDAFFNSLSKLLLNDLYEPGEVYFFAQHKDNFGIRKIAMLNIVDRVVYQAIFNKQIIGNKIVSTFNSTNYYPRLSKYESRYLQNYKSFYKNFVNDQKRATAEGYSWRGEFDVSAFYDNINHRILFNYLSQDLKTSDRILGLLKRMLSKWHIDQKGIPQGPEASSVLANYFLSSIDNDFTVFSKNPIRYLRYMDDIVILSSEERDLYLGIEKLTENLYRLDLNLNAKSDIEEVTLPWYEQLAFTDPYSELEGDDIYDVFNEIKQDIPDLIKRLSDENERKLVKHRELSKLKYYLKGDKTYQFAKEIILLYPHLPSFADIICKYVLPISSKEGVRFLILKVIAEHHLFRWQRFWLAKVLLLEDLKRQHPIELDFRKDKEWETRAISRFVKWSREPDKFNLGILFEAYFQSENEFESNLYISFLSKIGNEKRLEKFIETVLGKESLEGKIIVQSQFLTKNDVDGLSKSGNLFFPKFKQPSLGDFRNELPFIAKERLSKTLGFPFDMTPGKEMVLEILASNNELVLTGKLLDGKYLPASNTNGPRLVKLLISLCNAHAKTEKEKTCFEKFYLTNLKKDYPELRPAKIGSINLAREKADRLTPLLGEFIGQFMELSSFQGKDYCRFRRGINAELFMKIPELEQQKMAELAKKILNETVKS